MAQVRADPDELRQFSMVILEVAEEIETQFAQLENRLHSISEQTWQDQQRRDLEEEMERVGRILDKFLEQIKEQIDPLQNKAAILEDYLRG